MIVAEPPGYGLHLWKDGQLVSHFDTAEDHEVLARYTPSSSPWCACSPRRRRAARASRRAPSMRRPALARRAGAGSVPIGREGRLEPPQRLVALRQARCVGLVGPDAHLPRRAGVVGDRPVQRFGPGRARFRRDPASRRPRTRGRPGCRAALRPRPRLTRSNLSGARPASTITACAALPARSGKSRSAVIRKWRAREVGSGGSSRATARPARTSHRRHSRARSGSADRPCAQRSGPRRRRPRGTGSGSPRAFRPQPGNGRRRGASLRRWRPTLARAPARGRLRQDRPQAAPRRPGSAARRPPGGSRPYRPLSPGRAAWRMPTQSCIEPVSLTR